MSMLLRLSTLSFLLLVAGCPAKTVTYGGGASGGRPPSLGGRTVPMFDHYCATIEGAVDRESEFTELLDEASDEGWEMVTLSGALVCFKRPRGEPAAPPAETPPAQTPPAETPPAPQPPPA